MPPPFDSSQLLSFAIANMISGGLSLAGAAAMVTSILWNKPMLKKTRADEKILFFMAIVALLGSFAMVQNQQLITNPPLCQLQSSMIQFSVLSLPILNVALGYNFWYILSEGKSPERLVRYYIGVAFIVPLAVTLFAFFSNAYGGALIWCWIVQARTDLRFSLFFIPLWIAIVAGIIFTSLGVRKVFQIEKHNLIKSYKHTRTASKALLYGLVFIVVWIPGTTNRIVELVTSKPSPFILVLFHTFFTPLQGFLNSVVFFYLSQTKVAGKSTGATIENNTTISGSAPTRSRSDAGSDSNATKCVSVQPTPPHRYSQTPANLLQQNPPYGMDSMYTTENTANYEYDSTDSTESHHDHDSQSQYF